MKKPMVIMIAALVLVFGTLFGFIEGKKRLIERYLANFEPPPVAVSAHPAKREHWDVVIAAVGTLKAVHGVDLATEAAGVVTRMHFRAGDDVAAGDEIASLDDRVEVATLKSLLAQRRLAEINFERDQRLLATKAISRTDFDKTEAQLKDVSAFFKSASGVKYVEQQPLVLNALYVAMQGWQQQISQDMMTRVREEMKKKGHEM